MGHRRMLLSQKMPGVVEEYINLGIAWDSDKLRKQKLEIERFVSEASKAFSVLLTHVLKRHWLYMMSGRRYILII